MFRLSLQAPRFLVHLKLMRLCHRSAPLWVTPHLSLAPKGEFNSLRDPSKASCVGPRFSSQNPEDVGLLDEYYAQNRDELQCLLHPGFFWELAETQSFTKATGVVWN